jgi:Beta-galactosidase
MRSAGANLMKLLSFILYILICKGLQASTAKLTQSIDLPIIVEGKTVGSMKLPAGSDVEVVSVNGTNVIITRGDNTYTIASSSLGTFRALASASPAASPSATSTPIPFQASAQIDKTLNESSLSHFFIPCGEHLSSIVDSTRLQIPTPLKDGWVTVKDGHLYSGGKRLRIIGVNMVSEMKHTGYEFNPNDILEMKKCGINGVRLWAGHAMANHKKHSVNPEGWKNFDKLVAKLIENGMWIDLNLLGNTTANEVDPNITKLDRAFLKEFFAHVNPYTGRNYANEPALFCVELSNEEGLCGEGYLHSNYDLKYFKNFEEYKDQIHTRWNEWLRQKYADQSALDKAWPANKESLGGITSLNRKNWSQFPTEKEQDWRRFLVAMEVNWYKSAIDYIHKDLGYRGLVSTSAEISVPPVIANLGDVVRNQGYDRDPSRPEAERRPDLIGIDQSLDTSGVWRVAGKPFMHTEHNIYAPSPYSGETALFAFTAATVQDWDAIFLFFWDNPWSWNTEHNSEHEGGGYHDTSYVITSPTLLASLPTAANLFLRGDLKPATSNKFERINSDDLLTNGASKAVYGSANSCDLFLTRLGTAFSSLSPSEELFGDGGTCQADSDYNIEVNSPRTVMTITSEVAGKKTIGGCTLEVGKTLLGWVCFGVTSLNNDLPIKGANKILVTLIGSTGDPRKLVPWQKEWPKGPCMVECISANVFIPVDTSKGAFKAYSLDEKAQRKEAIPLEVTPEGITLHTTGKEGTVWYEISRG